MPDEKLVKQFRDTKPENRKEEDWAAIYDANTLASAHIIKGDAKRYARAQAMAVILLEDNKKEDNGLQSVIDGDGI